ncbi:MAG: hypothetical protein O2809_05115 [Proteobacteria bacterium]|nr:hypothetical protein [Pseudomonadota bacterium]
MSQATCLDIREYYKSAYLDKEVDTVDHFFAENATFSGILGLSNGLKQIKSSLELVNQMIEVDDFQVRSLIEMEDIILIKANIQATLLVDCFGINSIGKKVTLDSEYFYRLHNDKVIDGKFSCNYEKLINQLTKNQRVLNKTPLEYQTRLIADYIKQIFMSHGVNIPPQALNCSLLQHYGLPIKMISSFFECSQETINSHLKYSRAKFREQLVYGCLSQLIDKNTHSNTITQTYCRYMLQLKSY